MSAALKMKARFMLSGEAIKTVSVTCIITSHHMLKSRTYNGTQQSSVPDVIIRENRREFV